MMSVTLERLWLVCDTIINFRFFVKFHIYGPAIIFNFWTITEQVSYPSKKLLITQRYIKNSSRYWVLLWKDYGWFLIDFRFLVKFHRSGPAIIFNFWTITEQVSYPSKKLHIKPRFIRTSSRWWVLLWKDYGLVCDRIIDFRFFVKFDRSGPAIIWTSMEQVIYLSKMLLITQRFIRTLSRWWVLLWINYGWFLIKLSIFNFSSNFTSPDLQ